jgi:hypothetical protein
LKKTKQTKTTTLEDLRIRATIVLRRRNVLALFVLPQ